MIAVRRAALPLACALAACGGQDAAQREAAGSEPVVPADMAACALGGASEFRVECAVERHVVNGAQVIVVWHPDGAFHRLTVSADGQHLLAADGADEAQSALKQGRYEVILGDNRYVIPAAAPAANAPAR